MKICNIDSCTGCGACQNICPVNCLAIELNNEGFYKYKVNESICINCKLCKSVCPNNGYLDHKENIKTETYAAWNIDNKTRINSSSGGVFSLLAEIVLERKGVVFGAAFDDNFNVNHIGINSVDELGKLRGSKYIQSHTKDTYYNTQCLVNQGKYVLYSGTPCQIAGLYKYLGKDYDNLITCDLICHGNSSTKVYRDVLDFYEKKFSAKIVDIKFRDKKTGWKDSSVTIIFDSGKTISEIRAVSLLTYGFAAGLTNNKVCGRCIHALLPRRADITLGDYGHSDYTLYSKKEIRDGISLILVNSIKGKKYVDKIQDRLYLEEKKLEDILEDQSNIYKSNKLHAMRENFFKDYINSPFSKMKKQYLHAPFKTRFLYIIGVERYKLIKKLLNKLRCFS